MNKNSLIFILLLLSGKMFSQNIETVHTDTVSVKDMIANFQQNKKTKEPIDFFDCILGVSETNMTRLVSSPLCNENSNIVSNYHAKWELRHSQLILKEILPIGMTKKQADNMFTMLAKKYGGNYEKGIFASWYTGKLDILDCPYDLFGEWVSKEKISLIVEKGYVTSRNLCGIPQGAMSNCKKNIYFNDGCWTQDLSEISCLEELINKHVESTFAFFERTYSLLLFTDSSRKSSIYILKPQSLSWLDKKIIERLKNVIQILPAGSFSYLETLSGKKYQGRYLYATYNYWDGWRLKDYIR